MLFRRRRTCCPSVRSADPEGPSLPRGEETPGRDARIARQRRFRDRGVTVVFFLSCVF